MSYELKLLLTILATWRISSLFAKENGPFDLFMNIRKFIYTKTVYNPNSEIFKTLNNGIVCIWCNSVWFSSIASIWISRNIIEWVYLVFAVSALVTFLQVVIEWLERQ